MRRSFPFHDLGDDEFETLIAEICQQILGTGSVVFATGKDGGRDGKFEGTAQKFTSEASPLSGKFIVQAKHTGNPVASCSDAEFSRLLEGEKPKIRELIAKGELDHYILITNRKRPADNSIAKEADLRALGIKTAHILGIEQLRLWLTGHPSIWSTLGFDRFERHFSIEPEDLTTVVRAFHETLSEDTAPKPPADFSYIAKKEKNKINKLTDAYYDEILVRSLPYFRTIEMFLKNPRNLEYKELYEDTADELRRKIISAAPPFATFDEALTYAVDLVAKNNPDLRRRRRFVAIFMHYMYYTCEIGRHVDADETY